MTPNWNEIIRENVAKHREAVKKFDAQPAPAAYICFIWPHLDRWQAVAAYPQHRPGIAKARELIIAERRKTGQTEVAEHEIVGDALNGLAELVLMNAEAPDMMGPLALIAADDKQATFMLGVVNRQDNRNGKPGFSTALENMPCVRTVAEARAYVDRHPMVLVAKARLLNDLMAGPKH